MSANKLNVVVGERSKGSVCLWVECSPEEQDKLVEAVEQLPVVRGELLDVLRRAKQVLELYPPLESGYYREEVLAEIERALA